MIINPTQFVSMPWKNGAGETLEIFRGNGLTPADPESDDWSWRLSMARLDGSGPFSTFRDVDRILTFLGPGVLTLHLEGTPNALNPLQWLAFPGDAQVTSSIDTESGGPAWDLNLMGKRKRVAISSHVANVAVDMPARSGDIIGVFAAECEAQLDDLAVPQGSVGMVQVGEVPSTRVVPGNGSVVVFAITEKRL